MRLPLFSLGAFSFLLLLLLDGDFSLRNTCFVQPVLKRPCLAAFYSARAKHGPATCCFQIFGELFLSIVVFFPQAARMMNSHSQPAPSRLLSAGGGKLTAHARRTPASSTVGKKSR